MNSPFDRPLISPIAHRYGAHVVGIGAVLLLTGASVPAFGTVSEEELSVPVSLTLIEQVAHVVIEDQLATTQVEQVVAAPSAVAPQMTGTSMFHAGYGTHATSFAYWNGEQRVNSEIAEISVAEAAYNAVASRRRDPGLLRQFANGALSYSVFPFQGTERKRVEIRYQKWLERRGGAVEYRAPLTVGSVDVVVRDRRGVRAITSSSHAIEATKDGDSWRIRVLSPIESPKELVLRYETDEPPWTLTAWTHVEQGKPAWVAATLKVPSQIPQQITREVTILVDRSWSMKEGRLARARAAAERVLRGLAPTDVVNVIAFDDTTTSLYPSARPASRAAVDEAVAFVRGVGLGAGTLPGAALERALAIPRDPARVHQVVLITDGEGAWEEATSAVSKPRASDFIDVVLVGRQGLRWTLEPLTLTTGGRMTILSDEDGDSAVAALPDGWLGAPALTGLSLEAEGAELSLVEPASIAHAFPDGSLQLSARARGQGKVRLHLRGRRGTETVDHVTTIDLDAAGSPWVRAAWTYARIDRLTRPSLPQVDAALREEVIDLGLAQGCTSQFTAFVAIPESEMNRAAEASLAQGRARRSLAMSRSNGDPSGGQSLPAPGGSMSMPAERAGCASCEIQGAAGGSAGILAGIGLLAAASLRRRGRRRCAEPESLRRSEGL